MIDKKLLDYFSGDDLAAKVWLDKYALRDYDGNIIESTPTEMFKRLATEIHRIEKSYPNPMSYDEIYNLLDKFKYVILGGSNMFGIGNKYRLSSLANCFAIPQPADSIGGIYKTDQELAQIMKRRGGVGVDISTLRHNGGKVANAALTTTGSVSFAEQFSSTTNRIAQNGRRGALMITMDVNHKDIKEFITSKLDTNKLTGANISVRIDDKFMRMVEKGKPYETEIFELIVNSAWKSAEPGVLFWDTIKNNPAELYAETITTNPCAEVPLSEYDSCRLLSMNVSNYVVNAWNDNAYFDYNKYIQDTEKAQRIMDDIIDLEVEKIISILEKISTDPESDEITAYEKNLWFNVSMQALGLRRTGVGMTGIADAMAKMGLRYGNAADEFITKLGKHHCAATYKSSINMAKERGAFQLFSQTEYFSEVPCLNTALSCINSVYHNEYNNIMNDYMTYGRRNVATMAIAPNGTIAIVSQTSSGLEPVFKCIYKRRVRNNEGGFNEYIVVHKGLKDWIEYNDYSYKDEDELLHLFEHSPYYLSESHSVIPEEKIRLQGIMQKYIDHSISITHNLPENATVEIVKNIYFQAWKAGCKGCTIYREGSRQGILESIKPKEEKKAVFKPVDALKRPKVLDGVLHKIRAKGSLFWVIIGFLDDRPYEIFALREIDSLKNTVTDNMKCKIEKVKSGSYDLLYESDNGSFKIDNFTEFYNTDEEVITRLLSLSMRHYTDVTFAYEQIMAVKNRTIADFSTAIAKVLSKYINTNKIKKHNCPECGEDSLQMKEGCVSCFNCGYSKC